MRIVVILAFALSASLSLPAEDSARIYVYAQRLTNARSWLPISCDAAVVARLKRGKFFAIDVPPGRHALGVEGGVPGFIEVRKGGESFMRLDWHFQQGAAPIPVLNAIERTQARKEMRYLSYIEAAKVLAGSVPKADPREPEQPQFKARGQDQQ